MEMKIVLRQMPLLLAGFSLAACTCLTPPAADSAAGQAAADNGVKGNPAAGNPAAGKSAADSGTKMASNSGAVAGAGLAAAGSKDEGASYVLLGEQGQAVARVITPAANCPVLTVDGKPLPMQVRASAGTVALRESVFGLALSKPSAFPLLTCELNLPAGSQSALLAGKPLPLPPAEITRIVVLGDSGCRVRGKSIQNCNDANEFPFAKVAQAAARWQPQLVLHVGDYHYRESECPAGNAACAGSPWGYGWDAWQADFFQPAQSLLAAAPWVMVRGNHESCGRAGQGWWRWLDPRPLQTGRDCNLAKDDVRGEYSEPYAVPLGGDAQLLVFDTSAMPDEVPAKSAPEFATYSAQFRTLERLSNLSTYNFAASHHPLLGLYVEKQPDGQLKYYPGNATMQAVFGQYNALLVPPRVQSWMAGHVHTWQQLSFSTGHPSHFIAGTGGSAIGASGYTSQLPPGVSPAPGAMVASYADAPGFGFMTMERAGADRWHVTFRDQDGKVMRSCEMENRNSRCQP